MRLTGETVLEGVIDALRDQVAPNLTDGFAAEAARMAQSLIAIVGRAGDDAVAIRVEENARIRALLGEGGALLADEALAAAARSSDPGLRISELDAETGRLRAMLVDLHARIEQLAEIADRPTSPARAELVEAPHETVAPAPFDKLRVSGVGSGSLEPVPSSAALALDQAIWRSLRDFEMARAPRG